METESVDDNLREYELELEVTEFVTDVFEDDTPDDGPGPPGVMLPALMYVLRTPALLRK